MPYSHCSTFITHAVNSRRSKAFICVCLSVSVCLSVW